MYNSQEILLEVLAVRGMVAEECGRPGLSADAECSRDCNTLDAMASTEGEPIEDEADGVGRDTAATPVEVVVAVEEGVLEEDCAIPTFAD